MAIPEGVCWRGKAWVSPGLGMFLGHAGSHDRHSHMAHQVTIGLSGQVTVRGPSQALTAPAICIKAGTLHQIEGTEVLSIYLDALSEEARAMSCISAAQLVSISVGNTFAIERVLETPEVSAHLVREEVRRLLGLKTPQAAEPRMRAVLQALEERHDDRIRLAELVHLSPTRFSHWFVEQTGLPLRSYRTAGTGSSHTATTLVFLTGGISPHVLRPNRVLATPQCDTLGLSHAHAAIRAPCRMN